MAADLTTDGVERCLDVRRLRDARTTYPLREAIRVARLADDRNHTAHGEASGPRHEINWKNAAYAPRHHEPDSWDMSAFAAAQRSARSRWMR